MTVVYPERGLEPSTPDIDSNVYQPQEDSHLLISTMNREALSSGRRVADLCTGSGVVAIAAAQAGAQSVLAVDISTHAVHRARINAAAAGVQIRAVHGSWSRATKFGPFDLVVCNPPYVPEPRPRPRQSILRGGPALAYNGGPTGRIVLDPLCAAAPTLLSHRGTLLLVQSEFAAPDRTIELLAQSGLQARIAATQSIDFGPVLWHRASWLERQGLLKPGRRKETLIVIRADRP